MDELRKYLTRRIKHAQKRAEEHKKAHGSDPGKTHTYYGGQSLGYWQGVQHAYENILNELESMDNR